MLRELCRKGRVVGGIDELEKVRERLEFSLSVSVS
jgi:hypothetical protein